MKKAGKLKYKKSYDFSIGSHASIGFECLDRELFDPEMCYDILAESGVKYARVQTGWSRTEKVKGLLSFDWLEDIVDNLLKRGIQPWFNVGFGNKLYMPDASTESAVGYVPIYYGEETVNAWLRFADGLAEHFKNKVQFYEIWNEPDINNFWMPGDQNAVQYANFVNLTGDVIRKRNPHAKIGACVSSAFPSKGIKHLDYVWEFAQNVGHLDFFSYHRYDARPDLFFKEDTDFLRKTFAKFGNPDITLIGGECGYGSYLPEKHSIFPRGQSSERQQATALLRYFVTDAKIGARITSFFQTVDLIQKTYQTATSTVKDVAKSGVLNGITYTPKMSYFALRNISNIFGEDFKVSDRYITVITRKHDPYFHNALEPWTAAFERGGKPFYCYYYPSFLEDEAENFPTLPVVIQNTDKCDEIKDPVAVDSLTGEVFEPDEIRTYKTVKILIGMPVSDHPIFIFEKSEVDFTEE